ncbi:unnamed protein product [Effrenium voratum]|nr:unnamed protein product [Effrenium voratum]
MAGPQPDYGAVEAAQPAEQQGNVIVTEEQKAVQRSKPSWKDIPPLMTPWFLFGMVLLSTALGQGSVLCIISVASALLLSLGFLVFSRAPPWRVLAITCLTVTVVGLCMGLYDQAKYVYPYHFYGRSPSYTNVDPDSKPGSVGDAGYLQFAPGTHVDTTRSVGFVAGSTWCAAPVVNSDIATGASYWAVGKDCCRPRSRFYCGDAMNASVRSGVVIRDASPILQGELPQYQEAVNMAAETYGINLPVNPMFIRWNDTPEINQGWYWSNAVTFVMSSLLIFLLLAPGFLILMTCAGASLFGMEAGPNFHPEKLQFMSFGFDWTPRVYPAYVRQDLLNGRTFWTGEVIEDYVFHAANRHVYLGILFSHPAHPYHKWQRIIVALVATCASWFLIGCVSVWSSSFTVRTICMIGFCLTFRNTLKLILIVFGIQTQPEVQGGVIRPAYAPSLNTNLLGILLLYLLLAISLLGACSGVASSAGKSLGDVLSSNTDVFAYMYVLDFLVDICTPYLGMDALGGVWAIGFFGRWKDERDEYENAKSRNQKFRWTSLGAEVLGVGPGGIKRRGSAAAAAAVASAKNAQGGAGQAEQSYVVPHGVLAPTTAEAPLFTQFAVKKQG